MGKQPLHSIKNRFRTNPYIILLHCYIVAKPIICSTSGYTGSALVRYKLVVLFFWLSAINDKMSPNQLNNRLFWAGLLFLAGLDRTEN